MPLYTKERDTYLNHHPEHKRHFEQFDFEEAARAFHGSSFRPEGRAVSVMADYAQRCDEFRLQLTSKIEAAKNRGANIANNGDFAGLVDDACSNFESVILPMFKNYLAAESRCMSAMVVGPARFPTERNRKKMDTAQNRYDDISSKASALLKSALRSILPDGDGTMISGSASNAAEQLQSKLTALRTEQTTAKTINALVRKYYPKGIARAGLTTSDIDTLIQQLCDQANLSESTARICLKPCRLTGKVIPYPPYSLTNLNSNIKRIEARLDEQKRLDALRSESSAGELENGIRHFMTDDNKIAIDFGYKPGDEIRSLLKKHAFKFSPKRGNLWVRKHTANAQYAFDSFVLPALEVLPA